MSEAGNVVPSEISQEAWDVAICLNDEIDALLLDHNFVRKEGYSMTTEIMAKMVQLAINRAIEKLAR